MNNETKSWKYDPGPPKPLPLWIKLASAVVFVAIAALVLKAIS